MTIQEIIFKIISHIRLLIKQFFKATLLVLCFGSILLIAFHFMKRPIQAGYITSKEFIEAGIGPKQEDKTVFKKKKAQEEEVEQMVNYDNRYAVTYAIEKDTVTVYVHKQTYDTIQVGNWFEFDKTKGSFKAPTLP